MYIPYLDSRFVVEALRSSAERNLMCLGLIHTVVLKLIPPPISFLAVGEGQISVVVILGRCCHIGECVIGSSVFING